VNVFVTVGIEVKPFNRLMKAVDNGISQGLIPPDTLIQKGSSNYNLKYCKSKNFLDYYELIKSLNTSDIVIAHAGVGTVLLCLNSGKIPILFPRRSDFGEHVDNHQIDFARIMAEQGRALIALNDKELYETVSNYKNIIKSTPSLPEWKRTGLELYLKTCIDKYCNN
jgi:UDP-N-acetylglucosamine transferase subunit ALG13